MKENLYFIGAGGIGMANLERYFLYLKKNVAGYDRTPSALTSQLEEEGVEITYTDSADQIPEKMRNKATTLVVYTPAIPDDNKILNYFRDNGFEIIKRAALLGYITRDTRGICVAGSHGKTTTSSMIANILRNSEAGCHAFLGGILRNVASNLVITPGSDISVVEADEYDRSFHQLRPYIAIITSADPDHLDIYGDEAGYLDAFRHFTELIKPGGTLLLHTGLKVKPNVNESVKVQTYSAHDNTADWHAEDIQYGIGTLTFTLVGPERRIENLSPGVPVEINIDNAVAAAAAALIAGATEEDVRRGLEEFMGAKRRFEIILDPRKDKNARAVLLDDYAHSPNEIRASIESVRKLYKGKKITVIFQPHLYTRTRDFADDFADALSAADEVIMTEIYPARELPIEGVDSQMVLKNVKTERKCFCERKNLLNHIENCNFEVLMTLGAADIDRLLPEIAHLLEK